MKELLIIIASILCLGMSEKNVEYNVLCWSDHTQTYVQKGTFSTYDKAVTFKNSQVNKDCIIEEYYP